MAHLFGVLLGIALLVCALVGTGLLTLENFSQVLLGTVALVVIVFFSRLLTSKDIPAQNKEYIKAYIPLFVITCFFWAVWFQLYTVLTVYIDEVANRTFGSFTIPVAWKDSLQGLWVIIFSGVFAAIWTKMGEKQPKTPHKFALSMLLLGLGYLIFIPFIHDNSHFGLLVFALVLLVITFAELLISPIALSFITKIAPANFKSQMLALSFLGLSLGFTLGGVIFNRFYDAAAPENFYLLLAGIGFVGGVGICLFSPILNKMLKGID